MLIAITIEINDVCIAIQSFLAHVAAVIIQVGGTGLTSVRIRTTNYRTAGFIDILEWNDVGRFNPKVRL